MKLKDEKMMMETLSSRMRILERFHNITEGN